MAQIQFIVGISFIILFIYSLLNYKSRMANYFSLLCLCLTLFCFGCGFELDSISVGKYEFAINLEMHATAFAAIFWLLLSFEYHFNKNSSFHTKFVILIIPIISIFMVETNPYNHLTYKVNENGPYSMDAGPWWILQFIYTILVCLIGLFLFFKSWKKASYSIKNPAFIMMIGPIFPLIAFILYSLKIVPAPYNFTSLGLVLFVFAILTALMKFDFLALKEIAREHVFDEVKEGIIIIDNKFRLIDFNFAAQTYFQWLNPLNIRKNVEMFAEGRMICEHSTEQFNVKIILNGQFRHIGFLATPLMKQNKRAGEIFIFQDITEQTELLEELERLATYDTLSGLYNRRKLLEEGEREFYRAKRYKTNLSVLMIDIDYFKKINDQNGHLAGDKIITSLATECKNRIRKTDIIGRYGGEEFLILLPDTDLKPALLIADDIRRLVAEMVIEFDNQKIQVKISIGVSSTSCKCESLTELINESDKALYKAKTSGRNRVCTSGKDFPKPANE